MIQLYLRGHVELKSSGAGLDEAPSSFVAEFALPPWNCGLGMPFSRFSSGVGGRDPAPKPLAEKSNAVPGVFGVLVAEPKLANAPDPRPNADDAPAVGDAMLEVLSGAMLLKGFDVRPSPP